MPSTGTAYEGYVPKKKYKTKKQTDANCIVGEEYMDCVKAAMEHFMKCPSFAKLRSKALLVHDMSRVHSSTPVQHGLPDLPLRAVLQPARSPDLQPLDYGIFGFTKNELGRTRIEGGKWVDRVHKFMEILRRVSPSPTIAEFPLRLQACLNSKGEHFERALQALKK